MKARSPIRQLVRVIRFILNVAVLVSATRGTLAWHVAAPLYFFLWGTYIGIDALLLYKEQKRKGVA